MTSQKSAIPRRVAEQAVEWLLALQAEEANEDDLRIWLAQDDQHRRAWAHIQATNNRLQMLANPTARSAVLTPSGKQRRKVIKALTLLLITGTAGTLTYRQAPWRQALADITSGTAERRVVMLDNGSRLNLNSATAVNIDARSNHLRIRLIIGEILITTAHSLEGASAITAQPLSVVTAQGEIRPMGTRFMVSRKHNHTNVAVFAGRVALYPRATSLTPDSGPPSSYIVEKGQRTDLFSDRLGDIQPADENSTAWVDGMLVATSMPLGEFLQILATYHPGYLGYDPAVASLPVSGTYPLDNTDQILTSLAATLPIKVYTVTRYWVRVVPEG